MLKSLGAAGVFLPQDGGTVGVLSLERGCKNGRSWESEECLCTVGMVTNGGAVCICEI